MKTKLTTKMLDGLTRDAVGRGDVVDETCRGLAVRVTSEGDVTFSFVYSFQGERKRLTMGRYPDMSLGEAREKVTHYRAIVDAGQDPRAAGEPRSAAFPLVAPRVHVTAPPPVHVGSSVTFGSLCDRYLEAEAGTLRRSTVREYERKIRNLIKPRYGDRAPESMSVAEMRDWEDGLAKETPIDANRTHSLMARIFKCGIRRGLTEWTPYAALDKPTKHERPRERVLDDKEIVEVFRALRHERPVVAGLWELLFWTGLRESYAMRAEWKDVRFDAKDWHHPITKKARGNPDGTGQPFLLPMTEPAMEVLQFLRKVNPSSAYVFPGESPRHKTRKEDHPIANVGRAVDRMRDATGIDFQMRDIRRTISTKMGELHVPPDYISRVLDHTMPGEASVTHKHYLMYRFRDEKLYALTVWARRLMELIGKHRRWDSKAPVLIAVPAPPKPTLEDVEPARRSKRRPRASEVRETFVSWPAH